MDLFGHINNVAFFKYIQASRVHFWEEIGLNEFHRENNIGPILARTSCDFRSPLHFPGNIFVEARLKELGMHSFVLEHTIFNEQRRLAAEAEDVIVIFDFEKKHKAPVPAYVLEKLAQVV